MKSTTIFSLLLHKLCSQRGISCNQKNRSKSKKLLLVTTLAIMSLLAAKNSMAATIDKTYATYTNNAYYSDTHMNPKSPETSMDFGFLTQRLAVRYCQVKDLTMSFLVPGTTNTYVKLFTFSFNDYWADVNKTSRLPSLYQDFTIEKFSTMGSITTSKNYITTPDNRNVLWGTWNFPPALMGQTITLKVTGNWIWDYNNIKSGFTPDDPTYQAKAFEFTTSVGAQTGYPLYSGFNPTTTLTMTHQIDGTEKFTWNSSQKVSKFLLYSDSYYTKKVDSISLDSTRSMPGSLAKFLPTIKINSTQTYYVQQVYDASNPVTSSNYLRYTKNLGAITTYSLKYPSKLTATLNNCNQNVFLHWDINDVNKTASPDDKWVVERKLNTESTYSVRTSTLEGSATSFTDNSVLFNKIYNYRLRYLPKGSNITDIISAFNTTTDLATKRTMVLDGRISCTPNPKTDSEAPNIVLTWNPSWCYTKDIVLIRKNMVTSAETRIPIESSGNNNLSTYTDRGLTENLAYSYRFEIKSEDSLQLTAWQKPTVIKDYVKFKSVISSKGTLADRIQLKWNVEREDLSNSFFIKREIYEEGRTNPSVSIANIPTDNATFFTYDDKDIAPGILYKYTLGSQFKLQSGIIDTVKYDSEIIGFAQPGGTVSGRITYGSGTAVSNVSVFVENNTDSTSLYRSIKFNGVAGIGKVALTPEKHGCVKDGFSWQAWLKPQDETKEMAIYECLKEYSIWYEFGKLKIYLDQVSPITSLITYDMSSYPKSQYFHASVTFDGNDKLLLYVNGTEVASKTLLSNQKLLVDKCENLKLRQDTTIAYIGDGFLVKGAYNGYIDDLRLWSLPLKASEIKSNYNRYNNGNETGLIGYWQFDEGLNGYAFDRSNYKKIYNEHHIRFASTETSAIVPTSEQLSIKGITDSNGNYLITGVPYIGDGSTYSIKPMMGTHKFEPQQQLRYVSTSSLVHNGTDFTDKSSFPIKIKVNYTNTKYPVPGVMFYVDEIPCSIENKLILTASENSSDNSIQVGECVIDVPIGDHYIRAELTGHTFKDNGRWPDVGLKAFNENSVNTIEFFDNTLVTVAGRVVGGDIENSYPIGFKKSHANIGKALIKMEPTFYTNRALNATAIDSALILSPSENERFQSKANFKANSNKIEIITDATTGEYMVKLPPIQWNITGVSTSTDAEYRNDKSIIKDIQTFSTNKMISATDTSRVIETNKLDSFTYNVKKSFVYKAPTVIEVRNANANQIAFGESEWNITTPGLPDVKRKLYDSSIGKTPKSVKYLYGIDIDGGYPNGKPIFVQKESYGLNIYAYESYKHPEGRDTTDMRNWAKVPLKGAIVTVKNEIGVLYKKVIPDSSDTIASHVMKLDNKGKINYLFKAGFPNLADVNAGLGLSISVKNGDAAPVFWDEMGNFRGIVTGCEPIAGTNFVTNGPSLPLVVLRDPPGSNSYAYMEKGTSLSYSFVDKSIFNANLSASASIKLGPKLTTAIGFGFMALTEMESKNTLKIGMEGEYASFTGTTGGKTITTRELIQTSASPDFVGSNADVYIGVSTNLYYCQSKYLDITRNGLTVDTVSSASMSGDTEFRFSQNEIVTAQIPKWKQMLTQLLITVPTAEYAAQKTSYQQKATAEGINYYITSLNQSNVNFAKASYYEVIRPKNITLTDTIESIVNTINNWQKIISDNEASKKNASTNTSLVKDNISFDTGTLVERSYTYTDNKGSTSGGSDKTQAVLGTTFGFAVCSIGMQVDAETKLGGGSESENNSSTEKTTTFGYVLSDPDSDNRFSMNIFKNKLLSTSEADLPNLTNEYVDSSLSSYIFELVGGQSSCPAEVADTSLFYKENNKLVQLANGAVPLDAPSMNFPSHTKTDIPNGKDATFVLELNNNSIVQTPRAYMLSVDDASNKDGAIISVDGSPLTTGRIFYVTPGQKLTKTLTLHQTKLDVLDYQNIKINFSSVCDAAISVTKEINVTYVPSCSDLEITLDRQIINTENNSPLLVTFKNFNQEYKNFLGIQLQYKMEGTTKWLTKTTFAKNLATAALLLPNITADLLIPNIGESLISSFNYDLSFNALSDGNYSVRAQTLCKDGNNIINNITPEFFVVKDTRTPVAMGVPSPANGILTPETEISVTFNENIQTSSLSKDDFEVKGVLNGAKIVHAEGLAFDGTVKSQAYTESSISLQNGSFAIEGWVRTAPDCLNYGNLFTIGAGSDKVALNMKKDGIQLRVNEILKGSNSFTSTSEWQYVSLSYDGNNQTISVKLLYADNETSIISQSITVNPEGRLFVGAGFRGNIHQVSVWSNIRNMSDLSDMYTTKTGIENNIVGYWPMDEASGKMAADKVRNRNMIVDSSWFIEPNGKATSYNGVNQSTLIASIPITSNQNFSVEFWFKAESQSNATLFSCGKGDTDAKPIEKLSIGFNANKELCLNTKGNSYVVPNVSVQDTVWHHFALSVLRNGNSNVYIDGLQKLQLSSTKVGGMSSEKISLGSRTFKDSIYVSGKYSYKDNEDQYLKGSIDEVRIWGSALTTENIKLDMHSRLTGSEIGLKAYYPFEKTAVGGETQFSLMNHLILSNNSATSSALTDVNTPGIKIPRSKEDVFFTYTPSDNKIIFNITSTLAETENCTLELAIKKVYDLNGNMLASPIKWTAFVNNNRLNWQTETVALTKQVLDAATFKAVIVNNSGKYENYVIDGLPSWLRVDKNSGKLNPLEKTELTFTVDKSTNIGIYEARINLTGINGIQEMLPVTVKVTGTRPDWSVNPYAYESSMNVIGQVKIDDVYQEDAEDILAAFIGNRCVGLANPQFDKTKNSYVLFMDVYGNSGDNGQALTFSLWDAGTGRIYPAVDVIGSPINFIGTTITGTINAPQVFDATDKVEQQISLKQGWNWMSTNVVSTNPTLINQFKSGIETALEQLKSRDGYLSYSNGNWIDSENPVTIDQVSMYLLKTNQAKTIKMVGAMAKPTDLPILINSNWNYIGYVPQFVAPIKDALSNLAAVEGDQIKGQIGFATYSGGNWYGSLQYMMPGAGYMYNSMNSSPTSFKYPSQYFSQAKVARKSEVAEKMRWTVDANKFQMSMTATCVASINSMEVANSDMQVAVFVGDECRGTASMKYVESYNRYMAFIMVWGNVEDVNKKITFKSFNTINNQELSTSEQSLTYVPDNIIGTPVSPYQINFVVAGFNDVNMDKLKLYPNPVSNVLYFDCNTAGIERLEVIDNVGRTLIVNTQVNNNSINVSNLVPGVYTLRIKHNGNVTNHKFVRK